MTALATIEDLRKHWAGLRDDQVDEAEQKLVEAQIEALGLYPDLRQRIDKGALDPHAVKLVLCRMVKRALEPVSAGLENVGSVTQQQGGFSQTLNFSRSGDGTIYLTKADKRLLASREDGAAFTIHPGGRR